MSKKIDYQGQIHEFPDDFTDEDIAAALGSLPNPAPEREDTSSEGVAGSPPGVLAATGGVVGSANQTVRPAIAKAGKYLEQGAKAPGVVLRAGGAGLGGVVGARYGGGVIGALGGATIGQEIGRRVADRVEKPIRNAGRAINRTFALEAPRVSMQQVLEANEEASKLKAQARKYAKVAPTAKETRTAKAAAETAVKNIPKKGAFVAPSAARKIVNAVGGRYLPIIGNLLMAMDAAKYGLHTARGGADEMLTERPDEVLAADPVLRRRLEQEAMGLGRNIGG